MSSGLNCLYFETTKSEWYYVLESGRGGKSAWDWTEEASVVGPFQTFDKAYEYLQENNANPGSYFQLPYAEAREGQRKKYCVELAARAEKPTTSRAVFW